MIPAFQVNIGHNIHRKFVCFGKFEDDSPSLAVATAGGKILLHSPHAGSDVNSGDLPHVRFLNFNKQVTALAAGNLSVDKGVGGTLEKMQLNAPSVDDIVKENSGRDSLFVGTQSTVLAYDVQRNADTFFREAPDGVNALLAGQIGSFNPYVFAGGNCSVLGFDRTGSEAFWTVTGDNVSALTMCDVNNDGLNELVVGSDDYEIRVFENEELISEMTESDKISHLCAVERSVFSYGLANGTIGVYSGLRNRAWRVKTKHQVHALETYDLNADGYPEVISGWSNGALNVRNLSNGETMYKHSMNAPIAAIVCGDYRNDGKEEMIVCMENGDIRGFLPADFDVLPTDLDGSRFATGGSPQGKRTETTGDQKVLDELQQSKQELQHELHSLEKALKSLSSKEAIPGALPPKTSMVFSLMADPVKQAVLLNVEVTTDVLISNVVVIDLEGGVIQGGEALALAPMKPSRRMILPIVPQRNCPCTLRVQSHISVRGFTSNLYVFEEMVDIPRFSSFAQLTEPSHVKAPLSHVSFKLQEDLTQIISWIQHSFILYSSLKIYQDKMRAHFAGVKAHPDHTDNKKGYLGIPLFIFASREEAFTSVQIRCDDMDLASEVVQDMASYFKLLELESTVNFPGEMNKFEAVLKDVSDFNSLRVKMSADMADDSQRVKALVVRAEDARIMTDMETMSRAYTDLYSINNQLIAGYNNRAQSHSSLLSALKEVNQMIQKAANLRVGTAKTKVINDCRVAVKANNMQSLFKIIKQGYDQPLKK